MKKIFLFILSCILLSGCGYSDGAAVSESLSAAEEEHEETVLDILLIRYSDNTENIWATRINESWPYPDIRLNLIFTDWDDLYPEIEGSIVNHTECDIINTDFYEPLTDRNLLLPINDLLSDSVKSEINPECLSEYAAPLLSNGEKCDYLVVPVKDGEDDKTEVIRSFFDFFYDAGYEKYASDEGYLPVTKEKPLQSDDNNDSINQL